jgi:hypothetical protein
MPNGQSICWNENNFKFILYVLENASVSCTSYKYFIFINYLQMYYMKILLSHATQLDNNITIILKLSPQHNSLNATLHSNSMLRDQWKVLFGHNTSHFARWNKDFCNAFTSPNYPRNLPSFVWSEHKCN